MYYVKRIFFLFTLLAYGNTAKTQEVGWIKIIDGAYTDIVTEVEVAEDSNIYVIGSFTGTFDFDFGPGTEERTSAGGSDAFLLKLNTEGEFLWVVTLGGTSTDGSNSIEIDSNGDIYLAFVYANATDLDPTNSINMSTNSGTRDYCVMKLDSDGNYITHILSQGFNDNESIRYVHIDENDNLYISGIFYDTVDFDPSAGIHELSSNGNSDSFLMKLDSDLNFEWVKSFGGLQGDGPFEVQSDIAGKVYMIMNFHGTVDFDPGVNTQNVTSNGLSDFAILKLDSGGELEWVRTFGGSYSDEIETLKIDSQSNIICGGQFTNAMNIDTGSGVINLNSVGHADMLMMSFDTLGNYNWHYQNGGFDDDKIRDIEIGENGNFYCGGHFRENFDADPGPLEHMLESNGGMDNCIIILDSNRDFLWAGSIGGSQSTSSIRIKLAHCNSSFYISGSFNDLDSDLDPTDNDSLHASSGSSDGYLIYMADSSDCSPGNDIGWYELSEDSQNFPYPNPTTGKFSLDLNDFETIDYVLIVDASGNVIDKVYPNDNTLVYDLNRPAGFYIVQVVSREHSPKEYRLIVR